MGAVVWSEGDGAPVSTCPQSIDGMHVYFRINVNGGTKACRVCGRVSDHISPQPPKPPLGVMPETIWLEHRADELSRAIREYVIATELPKEGWSWSLVNKWSKELAGVSTKLELIRTATNP